MIQYRFTQDSIQNIIQFKENSADSIQEIIQFDSQGFFDTGRIGKVPENCPKSVQNRQKRGLFIKNGKYRFKIWFIHSFHGKIQFKGLFNIIFFRNIQFKKLFNNFFPWKIQLKNWLKNLDSSICLNGYSDFYFNIGLSFSSGPALMGKQCANLLWSKNTHFCQKCPSWD